MNNNNIRPCVTMRTSKLVLLLLLEAAKFRSRLFSSNVEEPAVADTWWYLAPSSSPSLSLWLNVLYEDDEEDAIARQRALNERPRRSIPKLCGLLPHFFLPVS